MASLFYFNNKSSVNYQELYSLFYRVDDSPETYRRPVGQLYIQFSTAITLQSENENLYLTIIFRFDCNYPGTFFILFFFKTEISGCKAQRTPATQNI